MELDWIEDFLALADLGVFSKAAMRRNVTQPAFTRRIRKLEYAVGAVLFDRSVHPVTLTPAGEDFRPTALEMVRMLASARSRLRSQTAAGEMVAIASLQALAISFLPPLIGALYANRTPPAIKVMADDMAGCLEALLTGSADILLTYSHPDIIPPRSWTPSPRCRWPKTAWSPSAPPPRMARRFMSWTTRASPICAIPMKASWAS